ncbi:MAG TPA: PKD domain-containing protein [Thermoanaerobaculia bacterium]|nr:PKD domain-containing protein [Thermoanaerobaculia bacterium]
MKQHFLAATTQSAVTHAALVAAVLFNHAKDVVGPEDFLTRNEVMRRAQTHAEALHARGQPKTEIFLEDVNRELTRLVSRLEAFSQDHLPLVGVRSILGPTSRQRGDDVRRIGLAIDYSGLLDGVTATGATTSDAIDHGLAAVLSAEEKTALDADIAGGRATVVVGAPMRGPSRRGLVLTIFIGFATLSVLAYEPARRWILRTLHVSSEAPVEPPTPAGTHVEVTPPPIEFRILEQRIDARQTAQFATVSPNAESICVDGVVRAFVQILNVPDAPAPPFTVLRNDEIVATVDRVISSEINYRESGLRSNRWYTYKLSKLDPATGEYHSSMAAATLTPKCQTTNKPPVLDSFSVIPTTGDAPLTVTCSASAHDPDGDRVRYYWSFGDGESATTEQPTITHTYRYAQKVILALTLQDVRGGEAVAVGQQQIIITGGPRPPLWSQAEEYKRLGHGEARPDAGPVGTLFHFRVFPRTSPVGAKPVLYRWSFNECRHSFGPDRMPPNADCASARLSTPEYQRRFTTRGQYTAHVEVTYDDGEVEVVPIATVNVGVREQVLYGNDGGMFRTEVPVPPTTTDPAAYEPIKELPP